MIEYMHPPKKQVIYVVSSDIRVVINGQEFVVSGSMLKPAPSNFQQEVLRRLDGIESRLGVIETEVTIIKHDQASLQTSVYWVLGAVGIFLAALGIPAIVASVLSVFKTSESKQADTKQADTLSITNSLLDAFTKGLAAGRAEKE